MLNMNGNKNTVSVNGFLWYSSETELYLTSFVKQSITEYIFGTECLIFVELAINNDTI